MDVVIQIFSSLGVDHSFYYQLGLVIFFLFSFYFLFVADLRRVLEQRKTNTVGAEDISQDINAKAQANEEKYQNSVQAKLNLSNERYTQERLLLTNDSNKTFKEFEQKHLNEYQNSLSKVEKEYQSSKAQLNSDVETLSELLVNKIKSGRPS